MRAVASDNARSTDSAEGPALEPVRPGAALGVRLSGATCADSAGPTGPAEAGLEEAALAETGPADTGAAETTLSARDSACSSSAAFGAEPNAPADSFGAAALRPCAAGRAGPESSATRPPAARLWAATRSSPSGVPATNCPLIPA